MIMKRTDGYKQTGLITPLENERILQLHTELSGNLFRARDLHDKFNISTVLIQRYLWIGRDLGLFAFAVPGAGNQSAVYKTVDVDAAEILNKVTRKTAERKAVVTQTVETDCPLANIMGLRPIEHDCKPRVVINNFRGGKIERNREKVSAGGGWMVGL